MKKHKRESFDTWYDAELERNDEYVLWDELNKYCHSDVMVLKAVCLKFIQEFQEEAGFNPIEKSVPPLVQHVIYFGDETLSQWIQLPLNP